MKASDLLVQCLEAEGVTTIFGIPGEETIDLMDSLTRSSIQFVLTRHEQAAAFMADVHGRLTGKPGVCLSTLGPGAMNLITGVANAHLDRSPLIAITGQAERSRLHKESHQNVDTIQLFKGITKYNQQILSAQTIPEIVRKAFDLATQDSPGSVHIQLPEDAASDQTDGAPLMIGAQAASLPDLTSLQHAAALIAEAAQPIILAGNGIIRGKAWHEVRLFAEKAGLPLVNTFMSKGILPFDHPLNLFTVGAEHRTGMNPLHQADLVIAIGFDLVEYNPVVWNQDQSRRVLNIHSIQAETDAHYPVELDLTGSLPQTLQMLTEWTGARQAPPHYCDETRKRRLEEIQSIPDGPHKYPHQMMRILSEQLPADAIVISDVGLHKVWTADWYQPKQPGRTIIFNGLASMGGSLPGAIASCLARPETPVVVVTGDGGFMMNSQELETAKRLDLSFTVIIMNDKHLSLIEKKQREADLAVTQITFTNPDFALYAQSFGIGHRRAGTAEQFQAALHEAINSKELNLLEAVL